MKTNNTGKLSQNVTENGNTSSTKSNSEPDHEMTSLDQRTKTSSGIEDTIETKRYCYSEVLLFKALIRK